jgi:hypothetical protein
VKDKRETAREREHHYDRVVAAATWRREGASGQRLRVQGAPATEAGSVSTRRRAPGLFRGFWFDPESGRRLQRASRREIADAYRLWAKHRDIREGRAA